MGILDIPTYSKAQADGRYGSNAKLAARSAPGLSSLLLPAYTGTLPTFATSGVNALTSITNGITYPYNTEKVSFLGGVMSPHKPFSVQYLRNLANGPTAVNTLFVTEFDYYGGELELIFGCAIINASRFWVFEDEVPVTAASQTATGTSSASSMYRFKITFASTRYRRLRIYWVNAFFGGITTGPTDSISAVPKTRPKWFFLGDSYIEGAGGVTPELTFAATVARALNVEGYIGGQGGTGYVDPGPGGQGKEVYGGSGRIGAIPPDTEWVVVFGTVNDDDNLTGLQAAASAAYAAIAARAPAARVIVIGPESNSGTVGAARNSNRNAIKAAALAASNVAKFIDPNDPLGIVASTPAWAASTVYALGTYVVYNGAVWVCSVAHTSTATWDVTKFTPTTWVFGTGKSGSPTGYGNADLVVHPDGIHLTNPIGNDYHTRLVFEAIRSVLAAS